MKIILLLLSINIALISNVVFAAEIDVFSDVRMELHDESGITMDPDEKSKRSFSLIRFRLEPDVQISKRLELVANVDVLEAISGGALTQTTYSGFSGMDTENRYLGDHGKNVEFFALNYVYAQYRHPLYGIRAGVIPFGFGYGIYYNDSLGKYAYQSPLEMETGKVSGVLVSAYPFNFLTIHGGFSVPSTARGKSLEKTGENKGEDLKKLLLRVDYNSQIVDVNLLATRGVGLSELPYSPFELGLYAEARWADFVLGQEYWLTGGNWGSSDKNKGTGWLNKIAYKGLSGFTPGFQVAYASGENNESGDIIEQFRFHGDFHFSHLLFRQVVPKVSSAKDVLGEYNLFQGVLTNAMAYKVHFDVNTSSKDFIMSLGYVYARKVANTATNSARKLGHEVDLDCFYRLDEGISLNGLFAYLIADEGFDISNKTKVYKVGASLRVNL